MKLQKTKRFTVFFRKSLIISRLALISFLILVSCDGGNAPIPSSEKMLDRVNNVPDFVRIGQNENMPTGGTIASEHSDSPQGCDISKVVDGKAETKFVTNYNQHYISWNGDKSIQIRNYAITSANDFQERDPKSWTLSASNDGKTWTTLDEQRDVIFLDRNEKKEYDVAVEVPYKQYRLNFTGNNGGASTQIAEWAMEEFSNELDPLAPYSFVYDNRSTNMPSAGTITSQYSDFPERSDISKIVDDYTSSKFVTYHNSFYIHWQGDEEAAVNFYSLTAVEGNDRTVDPKSWTLSASNDNETWTVIATETNETFSVGETKEYYLDNETVYKYYKLDISANHGGESTQITKWVMKEEPTTIEDLIKKAGSFSHSELTPLGVKFENRPVATPAQLAWLKDAKQEPTDTGMDWLDDKKRMDWMKSKDDDNLHKFSVNLYPYGSPIPGDAIQGGIGNCGLPATFASMAYQAPEFIKSIIKDNGDETFTIDMFSPQGDPLKVSVTSRLFSTNKGSSLASLKGQKGAATWAAVLEKAIWKWNMVYKVYSPSLGGIGSEHVTPIFTGNGDSFAFARGQLPKEEIVRLVKVALRQGYFVMCGFSPGGKPIDNNLNTISGHVYTAMHSSNKNALFAVRNPHGGSRDGVLNVPNNDVIYPTMDFRIIYPGKAKNYSGNTKPYTPPQ
jgi:hypothetical protein